MLMVGLGRAEPNSFYPRFNRRTFKVLKRAWLERATREALLSRTQAQRSGRDRELWRRWKRAGDSGPRERACRGVRGAKPLG